MIKVLDFSVIHFKPDPVPDQTEPVREVVLLYALGEDGIIYEFSNNAWMPLAIDDDAIRPPLWKQKPPAEPHPMIPAEPHPMIPVKSNQHRRRQ